MLRTLALLFAAFDAAAQGCAATPEAAARAVIAPSSATAGSGYRAADVQIDPAMKRVWIRIVRCDNASAPAILVPVAVPLRQEERTGNATRNHEPVTPLPAAPSPSPLLLVHAGDAVHAVYASADMHITLDGVADQSGAAGDVISLTLRHRTGQALDESEHRIRGMVRADKTIEVQP